MNKGLILVPVLLFILTQAAFSQETNPVYLDNNGDLNNSIYIQSSGSVNNHPSMLFHLPFVGNPTTNPGNSLFEFDGDDSGANTTTFRFKTSASNIFELRGWSDGSKSDLWFGDGNSDKFFISSTGDVGIGTTSPWRKLDVDGSIELSGSIYGKATDHTYYTIANGGNYNHEFFTRTNTGASSERFRIEGGAITGDILVLNSNFDVNSGQLYVGQLTGNVGIGTTGTLSHKLTVAGTINSQEIIVEETAGADFVFQEDYELPTLEEIEAFIGLNRHLPGIAPASEMIEEGVKVGELQMQLLQKIEELTLHMIELNKENRALRAEVEQLKTASN